MSNNAFVQELTIASLLSKELGDVELLTVRMDAVLQRNIGAPDDARVFWRPYRVTDFRGRRVSSGAERLSRWDDRHPNEIFTHGFKPQSTALRDAQIDLWAYVKTNQDSIFVGATRYIARRGRPYRWQPRSRFVRFEYEVLANGGIDLNCCCFGSGHRCANQQMIVFPGGIRREFIRSAREYNEQNEVVRIWTNAYYDFRANGVNQVSLAVLADQNPEGNTAKCVLWTKWVHDELQHAQEVEDPMRYVEGTQEEDRLMRIDATANPKRAALSYNGSDAYIFASNYYVRIKVMEDKIAFGPRPIFEEWASLRSAGFSEVDAAFPHPYDSNQAYIFCQDQYVRVQLFNPDCIKSGPHKITKQWASLKQAGFDTVDAAVPSPNNDNEVYFFSGKSYILAQVEGTDRIIHGPNLISQAWRSLCQAGFHTVDAALRHPNNRNHIYFFYRDKYVLVDATKSDCIISGPNPVCDYWKSLHSAGFY